MTSTNILNLHQLADTLAELNATETVACQPAQLDQLANSITHHHQQTGGPLRHALAQLLTTTHHPDNFAQAITIFTATVDLYAPPPPGQLTLF